MLKFIECSEEEIKYYLRFARNGTVATNLRKDFLTELNKHIHDAVVMGVLVGKNDRRLYVKRKKPKTIWSWDVEKLTNEEVEQWCVWFAENARVETYLNNFIKQYLSGERGKMDLVEQIQPWATEVIIKEIKRRKSLGCEV